MMYNFMYFFFFNEIRIIKEIEDRIFHIYIVSFVKLGEIKFINEYIIFIFLYQFNNKIFLLCKHISISEIIFALYYTSFKY